MVDATHMTYVCQWPQPPGEGSVDATLTGCRHVVAMNAPLSISDAAADPITAEMPWLHLYRAYLGVPVAFQGQPIGALCALSATPRAWSQHDRMALLGVANLVMLSLEHRAS